MYTEQKNGCGADFKYLAKIPREDPGGSGSGFAPRFEAGINSLLRIDEHSTRERNNRPHESKRGRADEKEAKREKERGREC